MSAPFPYLKVTSIAEREALVRALWAMDIKTWRSTTLDETLERWRDSFDLAEYLYMIMTSGRFLGVGGSVPRANTQTNSVAHLIAYMRRHHPIKGQP